MDNNSNNNNSKCGKAHHLSEASVDGLWQRVCPCGHQKIPAQRGPVHVKHPTSVLSHTTTTTTKESPGDGCRGGCSTVVGFKDQVCVPEIIIITNINNNIVIIINNNSNISITVIAIIENLTFYHHCSSLPLSEQTP